ncbi:MAG: type II toxin-antitoxin system Phd/YefM family antitoxin [Gemmobacter sp.]|nr:type II toxin-antitoxin system Phd/YefM family antitoxin [Gemmobacter sp.]
MQRLSEFRAGDMTRNASELFDAAIRAPVAITKHRKPKFVLMSMDDYAQLVRLASPPDGLTELVPQEDDPLEDWSRNAPGSR